MLHGAARWTRRRFATVSSGKRKRLTWWRGTTRSTIGLLVPESGRSRGGPRRWLRQSTHRRCLGSPSRRAPGSRSDYGASPDGGWARRHHASSARAGVSAQMNPSHTGTPNVLAAASPITTPADGRSQKYRYGTALVAHQAGRAARTFLMTGDRSVLEHLVRLTVRIACPGNTFDDDATHLQRTLGPRTRGGSEKPVVRRLTSDRTDGREPAGLNVWAIAGMYSDGPQGSVCTTTSDISRTLCRRACSGSLPRWCASARDPVRRRRVPSDGIRPTGV